MRVEKRLRTHDLAQAVQISVQQVRNYEAEGFLPEVKRSASGYRQYTEQHVVALQTACLLIAGYGRSVAQSILQVLHCGQRADALALIDEYHAELAAMRRQLEQMQAALSMLASQLPSMPTGLVARRLRVSAAAKLIGVQVSALRFWEQQGLLQPSREPGSNYRCYDEHQLRRLRIVALMRQANYDFTAIRSTLDELETGQLQRAVAAVEQRRQELAERSWNCLKAMAALYGYIDRFCVKA
jgi:DNA-binding transcriptional MerR regulator